MPFRNRLIEPTVQGYLTFRANERNPDIPLIGGLSVMVAKPTGNRRGLYRSVTDALQDFERHNLAVSPQFSASALIISSEYAPLALPPATLTWVREPSSPPLPPHWEKGARRTNPGAVVVLWGNYPLKKPCRTDVTLSTPTHHTDDRQHKQPKSASMTLAQIPAAAFNRRTSEARRGRQAPGANFVSDIGPIAWRCRAKTG